MTNKADIIKSFTNNNIKEIRKHSLKFAQVVTRALMNSDWKQLDKLIDNSIEIRDNVEFNESVKRTKEFYYGYWYAYENLAGRMTENNDVNVEIQTAVNSSDDLKAVIGVLLKEKAIRERDLIKLVNMSKLEFAQFVSSEPVIKSDIIHANKIGLNVVYSLNAKGRHFFRIDA